VPCLAPADPANDRPAPFTNARRVYKRRRPLITPQRVEDANQGSIFTLPKGPARTSFWVREASWLSGLRAAPRAFMNIGWRRLTEFMLFAA
jgi:hypothetical protein